jgi:hypothetical protein
MSPLKKFVKKVEAPTLPATAAEYRTGRGGKVHKITSEEGDYQAVIHYHPSCWIDIWIYEKVGTAYVHMFVLAFPGIANVALKKWESFFYGTGKGLRKQIYTWLKEQ